MTRALSLLAAALLGGLLTLAWDAQAQPQAAIQCAATPVKLVVKAENLANGKREGTPLPVGWTPVGGAGDSASGPLVIACTGG